MLRKRLEETPLGLKDLFRHMFSKIDKTHRENLKIYCHLLNWASRTEDLTHYTMMSLITRVLQNVDTGSLDRFISLCATCEQ